MSHISNMISLTEYRSLRVSAWLCLTRRLLPGLVLAFAFPARSLAATCDLVLRNAEIYTVDAVRSWAEVVAIKGGRFVYVGSERGASNWIGGAHRVVDLRGRMVVPGFHDAHVHLLTGGRELADCQLGAATNVAQLKTAIQDYVKAHPGSGWIRGGGWALPLFENANPHRALLDELVPDRPVFLAGADGHSAWVNSKALSMAGISRNTPDPLPGRIERDAATGEASGTLREDAMNLVSRLLPPHSHRQNVEGLRKGIELAHRSGITSICDADCDESILQGYQELERAGELSLKVVAALRTHPAEGVSQVGRLVELRKRFRSSRLRPTSAKIYADGVIESGTAALLEPYLGKGDDRGRANFEPEALNRLAAALDREGFQIHVHAIGDRAIRETLNAFQHAEATNGRRDGRHQIAHLELWHPDDIPRFRALGVIANFQPLWAYADPYVLKLTLPVLGPKRSRWLYPFRSVLNSGAVVTAGSDWAVSSISPVEAIQIATTRRGLEEGPGAAWIPEETADLPAMLAAYTINGAYANFQERETGSIEPGKAADLVVLDRNLFQTPLSELYRTVILATLADGKVVYRDKNFPNW